MPYRFVQGLDYGGRKGTLGFVVHMTEGSSAGAVSWLRQHPGETYEQWRTRVRGVSAHFVILADGEIVQMVAWGHAAGSMAPGLQGPTSGFYNRTYLHDVLGDRWADPNAWSLAMEVAGYREDGPTPAQLDSMLAVMAEARRRYPQMRGAYGHHDQTPTKGCPGTSPRMLAFWSAIGHGLFAEDTMRSFSLPQRPMLAIVPPGSTLYPTSDLAAGSPGDPISLPSGATLRYIGKASPDVLIVGWDADPDKVGKSARFVAGAGVTLQELP